MLERLEGRATFGWKLSSHSWKLLPSVAMSNRPPCNSKLVQRLITSYFPLHDRPPSFVDSLLTSTDGYVSETPESKQGNVAFYLGLCNTVSNSPSRVVRSSRALFEQARAEEAEILRHSPTLSSESVNQRA